MAFRYLLRQPSGEVTIRSVSDSKWADDAEGETVGADWWALPGLVDAHSHISAAELDYQPGNLEEAIGRAGDALRAGVTLLLDKGWTDETAVEVFRQVPVDQRPDIEAAARLIANHSGYYPGFAREIDPGDIAESVREEAQAGEGWVKVVGDWPRRGVGPVANFSETELRLVVAVAEQNGARVAIHTMAEGVPSTAVKAGVHSIEHGLFLTPADLDLLGSRGGMWVPTFLRIEATLQQLGPDSSGGKLLAKGIRNAASLLSDAVDAGVRVLAGTDLVGSPADIAAEAFKLMDYGLGPAQMLDAVSTAGLEATGRSVEFDVGAPADAVFFPANPLHEPGVLAHPAMVLRHGRVVP